MSKALALKYRPQTFDDVVGQETTVRILKNILAEKRIHHATLLTGPRGVGKTTLARLFAKALNCEQGPTVTPCNQCTSCIEIRDGRSLSVLEIDGASNTSVEDVREIREKIRYLPPGGRYKIYIIDEVHMLSTSAFNALLKTLEEPPSHALFIFATTEPQKMPVTIISRCLRFDLRPIPVVTLVQRLREIAKLESIPVEEEALFEIARESTGGLRDALGLLDQAVSYAPKVDRKVLTEILGASPRPFVRQLVTAILARRSEEVLGHFKGAMESGVEPRRLAMELLEEFRHLLVARFTQDPELFDLPTEEIAWLKETATPVQEASLDRLFRMLERTLPELLRSPVPRIMLEVLLLRLCRYEELESLELLLQRFAGPPVQQKSPPPQRGKEKEWNGFLREIREKRPQIASLVEASVAAVLEADRLLLSYPSGSVHSEMIREPDRQKQLEELLARYFERPVKVVLGEAAVSAAETQLVDEAVSIFQPQSLKTVRNR